MRSLAKSLVAAAVTAAFAAPALAADVTFSGYANGSVDVTYKLDYTGTGNDKTGTVGAGGFLAKFGSGPSFVAYCVDLYDTITFGQTYTDYASATSPVYASANSGAGATAFFNPNALTAIGQFFAANHSVSTTDLSAAFQVALWELTFETSGTYNVSTGSAIFTSANANVLSTAQSWVSALGASTTPFAYYQSRAHQDIVVTPVPEPETYALMAAGLGALGWVARRRKAKDAAKA